MIEVIKWLESPEGEEWSCSTHCHPRAGILVSLKEDFYREDDQCLDTPVFLWVA